MARVPYFDKDDLPPEHKDLLARGINLHRALVNSPNGTRAFSTLGRFIRFESKLDPRLRELAILQVGWLARSPYEWSHHVKIGYDFGVTDDDIRALIEESEGRTTRLEPLARTVLKAAREMTADGKMSKATWDVLAHDLDNERLTDLVITISFYNAVVRVLASLEIDVEDSYMPYLEKFPLPPG